MQVAREVNDPNAYVVTFLCDTGERYLSKLYNDEWMRENQLLDTDRMPIGSCFRENRMERHASSASRPQRAFARRSGSCRCTMCRSCR